MPTPVIPQTRRGRIIDAETLAEELIAKIKSGDHSAETLAEAVQLLADTGHTLPALAGDRSNEPARH
jgi:hypothetical protein